MFISTIVLTIGCICLNRNGCVQCAKFHFWVTPDFLTKSGVTFNKKIGIGIGSENREWLLQEVRQDIDMLRE